MRRPETPDPALAEALTGQSYMCARFSVPDR